MECGKVICLLDKNNYAKDRKDLIKIKYSKEKERHPIRTKLFSNIVALWADKTEKRDLKDDVTYLPYNKAEEELSKLGKKWNISFFQEGQILIEHPFISNLYLEVSDAEQEIVRTKNLLLSEVLQNLGAKSINANCEICKSEKRIRSGNGDLKIKDIKINAELKHEIEEQYKSYASFKSEYKGVCDSTSYHKALELCHKYHFDKDEKIMSLVRQRDPAENNLNKKFELKYSASSELNSALDIAFDVAVMSVGKGNMNYKSTLSKRYEINTALTIYFE